MITSQSRAFWWQTNIGCIRVVIKTSVKKRSLRKSGVGSTMDQPSLVGFFDEATIRNRDCLVIDLSEAESTG
jgi:hypothetical protein